MIVSSVKTYPCFYTLSSQKVNVKATYILLTTSPLVAVVAREAAMGVLDELKDLKDDDRIQAKAAAKKAVEEYEHWLRTGKLPEEERAVLEYFGPEEAHT